ncbi:hypothetical protein [Flavobacterium sp. KMS]|jgi:hypothetical protein|uniref:hypothetical protein n=1 Tax=unclassified Flavobacterium TaxID=196869 RepID=UPI00057F0401|nr:hypothetical protein [Flavobacterium sp. KMS]KIA97922.1 hypothetical protein OA93_13215 [Flavobacterium sp. KMS]KIC03744.1 hypothetical protein OA88_01185 [Flavobacterium sp. JRM]
MLKNILNIEGAQNLSKSEQKMLVGGGKIPSGNCKCFCYNGGPVKISSSCFSYCADGTIPGLEEGSTGNCTFPGGGA